MAPELKSKYLFPSASQKYTPSDLATLQYRCEAKHRTVTDMDSVLHSRVVIRPGKQDMVLVGCFDFFFGPVLLAVQWVDGDLTASSVAQTNTTRPHFGLLLDLGLCGAVRLTLES